MLWDRDEQTALGVYALLALVREFLPAMLVRGDGAILSAQGASAVRARGRVLVRWCGHPRAVTARCRCLELSTFPGVENVALAPS